MPTVLDGTALAARRAPAIAARSAEVRARRGRAPRLLIVAFADAAGRLPHVAGKLRAAAAAGIDIDLLRVEPGVGPDTVAARVTARLVELPPDGVFVQFPFPPGFDGAALMAAIPPVLDVDVMTDAAIDRFMSDAHAEPPVTVTAGLLLLDEYGVDVAGLEGVVVAEPGPFAEIFRLALARRGARMAPLVAPETVAVAAALREAQLVVVAGGVAGFVRSAWLRPGAVAVDVGYFNARGRGNIDALDGVDHLAAIAPVPGGIGPMTVSALLERVVAFAARSVAATDGRPASH
jgi:methylenetetrahydrofolate dehydrogenase (NADP+) / methenyltetrahydrofolate cyclohydrolase